MKEASKRMRSPSPPRPRSQGSLPGTLLRQEPNFVTSIAVVSRAGSLLSLTSTDSCLSSSTAKVEARHPRIPPTFGGGASPNLTAHTGFVTNIQFGSLSLERGRVGAAGRRFPRAHLDSLATGSLLSLTRPRGRGPGGKLSSYVLEERLEPRIGGDDREQDEFDTKELSATVLDKGEETSNLYRTISRKRLLRQYKDFQIPEGDEGEEKWEEAEVRRERRGEEVPRAAGRPLARILERLHALQPAENTYVSLTSDSLYTSLQNGGRGHDDNNNHPEKGDGVAACPVLVSHLLACQAETALHARATGCPDCHDYAASLQVPHLTPDI